MSLSVCASPLAVVVVVCLLICCFSTWCAYLALVRLDDNGVEETLAADSCDHGRLKVAQPLPEDLAHCKSILRQIFLLHDPQRGHGNSTGQRVAAKGGAVLSGFDGHHNLVVGQNGRDGQDTARERLAQHNNVRLDLAGRRSKKRRDRAGAKGMR